MKYYLFLFCSFLILTAQMVSGQYYNTGQDPSSLKWLQIKTGRFTVIYPEKYGVNGKEFAKSLDQAYLKLVTIFPEKKFRIPVIIHNFSTQSNGYVAWAPKRMEIYPTPEQNSVPLDANTQLALHELAHVFQMESINTGFSKMMSYILGEQFTGIVSSLLPLWLLEGDAVFAESVLSESGRGRNASFQKQLKALAVENSNIYNYDKSLNGSFRNYVPDHYQSGFQMVTWALAEYDPQIWNKVFKFTGEQPFTLNPVNLSLTKNARLKKKKLYEESFDTLKTIWTKEIQKDNAQQYETLSPEKNGQYITYYSPVLTGDSIFAVKTSLSAPPAIVLINRSKKTEKTIHVPGQIYPYFISYAKGKLVWVEGQPDMRWENRDYSVIKIMDLSSHQTLRLSHKSRYMSASLSPDGKTISAIENTINNLNNMVFIDAETGRVLQSVPAPGNVYLQRPQWSEKGGKITVIYLTEGGEGIMSYSFISRTWDTLIETGKDDLQSCVLRNDSLFFISSLSGTDNIYLRTPGKNIKRLTRSRFGTTDLFLMGNTVYFSDYASGGNSICDTRISSNRDTGINISTASYLINRIEIQQKSAGNNSGIYTPQPYRKWQHLFRFHSWIPFYADIEQIKSDPSLIRPGFTLQTQNSLSTLTSSIGYEYSKEKNHVLHSRVTWQGWLPVIESQLDYGNNPLIYKTNDNISNPYQIQPGIRFLNTVSVPLNFSSGKFSQYFQPFITSDYRNDYIYIPESGIFDYGQTIFSGRLFFSDYYLTALRDIYPRWAQTIDINYSFAPYDKNIYGTSIGIRTSFYLPGILPNHGIKIRIDKEKQNTSKFLYGNFVSLPRGYKNLLSSDIDFLSVDYVMPIICPDFNIVSLLYLKRIRSGFFYDQASGPGDTFYESTQSGLTNLFTDAGRRTLRSAGVELMADFHVLRIPYMISGGVRSSWININKQPVLELLFNIDLYGMTIGKRRM